MTQRTRLEILEWARSVAYAIAFSVLLRFAGPLQVQGAPAGALFLNGLIFGTSIYLIKSVQYKIRFPSFGLSILAQFSFVLATLFLTFAGVVWMYSGRIRSFSQYMEILFSPIVLWNILAVFISICLVSGVIQISRKLGPGVLRNWMLGRYHEPTEERRVFMFLDMKDSTTIAEQLGAVEFSRLVRDFFADLTEALIESKAEVSHYIGDEAVISWSVKNGLQHARVLKLYFMFKKKLEFKADKYIVQYGIAPTFRAGAHIGSVVACEVGEIKSEIVYHGDVVNTAARLQGLCGELGESFVISGELAEQLLRPEGFRFRSLGPRTLKGKAAPLEVIAVDQS